MIQYYVNIIHQFIALRHVCLSNVREMGCFYSRIFPKVEACIVCHKLSSFSTRQMHVLRDLSTNRRWKILLERYNTIGEVVYEVRVQSREGCCMRSSMDPRETFIELFEALWKMVGMKLVYWKRE